MKYYNCKSLVSGSDDMLPDTNNYFQDALT